MMPMVPLCGVSLPQPLAKASFVVRRNRFAAEVETDVGRSVHLHVPNSGRMTELLVTGAPVMYAPRHGAGRRTAGDMLLIRYQGRWVSVDARMPNRLFRSCFDGGAMPSFTGYTDLRAEAPLAAGRIDFLLRNPEADHLPPECWVETKSCNLVEEGTALFPDAPTERGTRHLRELQQVAATGAGAAVVFFIQRDDAHRLRPNAAADPAFAAALAEARTAGVQVLAYRCRVTPQAVGVLGPVPVELN